ncbi:MAG: helix-turn-helix domain-containing protein [Hydrococcus sp. RM1_1_31]|nr:helix-turn-helix domain-containing protein [Hydrococcus sp. RM1_1_31]
MSRLVKIQIVESAETLKKLLLQEKKADAKEKIQALYLLKTATVETVQYLATVLGRHRTTVQRWLAQYRAGGLENLLATKPSQGRKPVIPQQIRERLRQELVNPEGFESYTEVKMWLETMQGVSASYKVVHDTVRYQMKAKLKVPRPTSSKQEPGEIDNFKKNSQI